VYYLKTENSLHISKTVYNNWTTHV